MPILQTGTKNVELARPNRADHLNRVEALAKFRELLPENQVAQIYFQHYR